MKFAADGNREDRREAGQDASDRVDGADGLSKFVVDFENDALSAIVTVVPLLVLVPDDIVEGVHNVGDCVTRGSGS